MTHYDLVWAKCKNVFPILGQTLCDADYDPDDLHFIVGELRRMEIGTTVYETVWLDIDARLRQHSVPHFWQRFATDDTASARNSTASLPTPAGASAEALEENAANERAFYQFQVAVLELHTECAQMDGQLRRLGQFREMCELRRDGGGGGEQQTEVQQFQELLRVVMLSQLPANFQRVVHAFYSKSFRVFLSSQEKKDAMDAADESGASLEASADSTDECTGCDAPHEQCRCADLVQAFITTNRHLLDMRLLDRLAGVTLTSLIQQEIQLYVHRTTRGQFDMQHLDRLTRWLDNVVLNWLHRIYCSSAQPADAELAGTMRSFRVKLASFLHETYASTLIEQFFSIIIDFPDSQPAIDDLRRIFERLDCRAELVRSAKQALQVRLLHPGVNTNDILTGYVASIKAIRHLDASGVLLETITEPVKQYMRGRTDAVRCVVTALTEEGPADLAEELAKSETLAEVPAKQRADELSNWETWQPDPVDVNPKKQPGAGGRCADIISMVVDIYGSKEMFVVEYRNLLADRLLTQLDFSPEKEIRNLELLKLRFGDSVLHNCEVMLKDISDSKRIDAHIHGDGQYRQAEMPFEINSLILSSQFWPTFKAETIELPPVLNAEFERYTKSYESYKGNRTLVWRPAIGRVDIEIELGDRTVELTVSPSQAAIIHLFQEREQWTMAELSATLKLPASVLRKRMALWQTHGIIREQNDGDLYVLVPDSSDMSSEDMLVQTGAIECCDEDEAESAMASASEQREEDLQVFWSYIVGMLTNLGSMQLERVHQMLKMFASHGPGVEFSPEELKNFLQRKVREHKLIFTGGVYHLPK